MDFEIKKSFEKDIAKIRDKKLLLSIYNTIEHIQQAETVREIENIKKLTGYKKQYRIKIGDYRLGFFVEKNIVFLVRFLHRKDIYRFFP
ncbi:MAG TPA: type II toxin-antitoxin system RelE/ParE family toxin [Spirochaetota bacterium]|nr:type II toxin-antitoxin system RelE/ParE family toxin [Spirochaetota bacterium]HNT12787.1 type II toxin-antitoxin system RelE/ParE family toxin [Spirochaetota bacterium]